MLSAHGIMNELQNMSLCIDSESDICSELDKLPHLIIIIIIIIMVDWA